MDRKNHDTIRVSLDGEAVDAVEGDTVAAALLRNGITTFTRSIKYHRPRGPFCLQGTCGQCLMRIDGVPSLPACRVRAQEGMKCERQNGPLGVDNDVFRAADFVFGEGLDHHHLLTGSRVLGRVALEIARRLAGLGELPSQVQLPVAGELRKARVAVVGAGRAGLAAARAARADLLIERDLDKQATDFTGEFLTGADCVGLYANDTSLPGDALLAVRSQGRLIGVVAERVIVATGGASQPLPFPGCDRPGVYAARGLLRLPMRVGEKLVVVGDGSELTDSAGALERMGYTIVCALDIQRVQPKRALGNPVRALDTSDGERIRCDAIAIALPPAPLHDLASSAGAQAKWVGAAHGFVVQSDAAGRAAVPWLFVAGRVAGREPVSSGEAAGRAAAS